MDYITDQRLVGVEKETLAGLRLRNRLSVLETIKQYEPISRSKIASLLQMSRSNVSEIVQELLMDGLVREQGVGTSTRQGGRRPIHLSFVADAKCVLGIDIGATKTIAVIVDLKGNVLKRTRFSSQPQEGNQKEPLTWIRQQLVDFLDDAGPLSEKIVATGIGVPGSTDVKTGETVSLPGLATGKIRIADFFADALPGPIYVDNDVNMGLLGEAWKGAAAAHSDVVFMAVGTGIGAGVMVHRKIYRGKTGFAGEIGYLQIDPLADHPITKISEFGPLEAVASGRGLEHQVALHRGQLPTELGADGVTAAEIFAAARQGDELANHLVDCTVKYLAYAIATLVVVLDPEVVILGGGVAQAGDYLVAKVRQRLEKLSPIPCDLALAQLGDDAAALGASARALLGSGNLQQF